MRVNALIARVHGRNFARSLIRRLVSVFRVCSTSSMQPLRLHDVPFELVPQEVRLLMIDAPAGFPSPAADDLEEPIDLGSWLIEHPAASYVMRVAGESMTGAGINDGGYIVVSRSVATKYPRSLAAR